MDILTGNIKRLYWKYLAASVTGAVVMSIYSFVDMIAIGQSEGPVGTAAMAVITPFYGIMVFLAIMCGVGGAVLMGNAKGEGNEEKGNACFTAAMILIGSITVIAWAVSIFLHKYIFIAFGANETTLPKILEYAKWVAGSVPVFVFPTFIGHFIRNDGNPLLVTIAVIVGGCVNAFGDWFFVFPLGMGMEGAAIATVLGSAVQAVIMCSHFFLGKCHLRFAKPRDMGKCLRKILLIGFSAGVLELGNVVLTIVINNQIMRYGDVNALAVFGLIASLATLFQSLFNGVGQGIQPIVSINYGAGQNDRIKQVWRMSFVTVIVMGIVFTALGELFPTQITQIFIDVTPEVLAVAPSIFRPYFLLYLFLGITILSTYYLQATLHKTMSMIIALLRSMVLSVLLLYLLPLFLGILGVWLAMPVSELIVAIVALIYITKINPTMSLTPPAPPPSAGGTRPAADHPMKFDRSTGALDRAPGSPRRRTSA